MDTGKLFAPFPPALISWRIGSMAKKPDANGKNKGRALAYIDARDVMRRLDDVCGPANWQCRYPHANGKTICEIGIKIDGEWVWKANGAGDTDIEAEKGAISDAFKRAAVLWGIGRYLYDLDSPWVEVNAFKQIEAHEHRRLERILAGARIETPEEASTPPPARASDDEIAAYCTQFHKQIGLCKNRKDVEEAWKNGATKRGSLHIEPGSDDYERLAGFCKDQIETFPKGDV
jgi:hypothetical protein